MSGAAPKSKFTLKAGPSRPPPPGKTITMESAYSSSLDDPEVTATGELADTAQQDAVEKRKRDNKRRNKLRKNQSRGLEIVAAAPLATDDLSKHYLLRGDDEDASMADAQQHRDRIAAAKAAKEAKGKGGKETMSNRQKRKIAHELRKAGKPIPEHLTLVRKDGSVKEFIPSSDSSAPAPAATAAAAAAATGKKEKGGKKSKKAVAAAAEEEEADDGAAAAPAAKRSRSAATDSGAADSSAADSGDEGHHDENQGKKGKDRRQKKAAKPMKSHFLSEENARALALLGIVAEKQEDQIDAKLRKEQAKLSALEAKAARRAEGKKKKEVAMAKALQEVRLKQKEQKEIAKMLAED